MLTAIKTVPISLFIVLTYGFGTAEAETYYVDDGRHLEKVRGELPPTINVSHWEIRLYIRGASPKGRHWWGLISGPSYEAVTWQLEREQAFQKTYLSWTAGYLWEDFVYSNALGPIAVLKGASVADQIDFKRPLALQLQTYRDRLDDVFSAYENMRQELLRNPTKKSVLRRLGNETRTYLDYLYFSVRMLRRFNALIEKASTPERLPEISEEMHAFLSGSKSTIRQFQHETAYLRRETEKEM